MTMSDLQKAAKEGYELPEELVIDSFKAWMSQDAVMRFVDIANGNTIRKQVPRRGNTAYANKMRVRFKEVQEGMSEKEWDFEVQGARGLKRTALIFMITLTYDQKLCSKQKAWSNISTELSRGKRRIAHLLQRKHLAKSIRSITVKEGNKAGYPAPHMLLIVDNPILVQRHRGKNGFSWRLQSKELKDAIAKCWTQGFVDVQPVISNHVGRGRKGEAIPYLAKYLEKSLDPTSSVVALKQFAYQKLFSLRPVHISRSFKQVIGRLDNYTQMNRARECSGEPHKWCYDGTEWCHRDDTIRILIQKDPPHPPPALKTYDGRPMV